MVPGSTLMYGSSLRRVILMPRDSRIAARDAEAIPLPREETTPPVTKMNFVIPYSLQLACEIVTQYRSRRHNKISGSAAGTSIHAAAAFFSAYLPRYIQVSTTVSG